MKYLIPLLLSLLTLSIHASDHIDGAPSLSNPQADLTDLYAFPTPDKDNNLTVILNMYSGVSLRSHFSPKVDYEIEIRQLDTGLSPQIPGFSVYEDQAVKLRCHFYEPPHSHNTKHKVKPGNYDCTLSKNSQEVAKISGTVDKIVEDQGLKMFVGPRSDPFFLSGDHFKSVTERTGFSPSPNFSTGNLMHSVNVMSMVVEIDMNALELPKGLIGIAARSIDSSDNVTIDRVGRPEITNYSLHAYGDAPKLKRSYNQKTPFAVSESNQEIYRQRIFDNIKAYDELDDKFDWNNNDYKELELFSKVLAEDFLTVNMAGACIPHVNDYLAIEKSIFTAIATSSCGGRHPEEDIMATLSALYIGGINAQPKDFSSGVNIPYQSNGQKTLSTIFPYLDSPSKTTLKAHGILLLLKATQE